MIVENETFNIISTYVPQVGVMTQQKVKFWKDKNVDSRNFAKREDFLKSGSKWPCGERGKRVCKHI